MGGNEQYYDFVSKAMTISTTKEPTKLVKEYIEEEKRKAQIKITKCFKKYIVKRPNGNCQVLFALTELDDLVDEIINC
jgi:hypothetical protein